MRALSLFVGALNAELSGSNNTPIGGTDSESFATVEDSESSYESWISPHILEQLRPTTIIEGMRGQRYGNACRIWRVYSRLPASRKCRI
jgi:hypothetical protein